MSRDETEPPTQAKPPRMGYEGRVGADQARLGTLLWEAHALASRLDGITATAPAEARPALLQAAEPLLLELAGQLDALGRGYSDEAAHLPAATLASAGAPDAWERLRRELPPLAEALAERLALWHEG